MEPSRIKFRHFLVLRSSNPKLQLCLLWNGAGLCATITTSPTGFIPLAKKWDSCGVPHAHSKLLIPDVVVLNVWFSWMACMFDLCSA